MNSPQVLSWVVSYVFLELTTIDLTDLVFQALQSIIMRLDHLSQDSDLAGVLKDLAGVVLYELGQAEAPLRPTGQLSAPPLGRDLLEVGG